MTRRITPSQTETPRDPRRKGTTPEFPFTPGPCLDVGRTSELTGVRRHLRRVHDRAPSTSPCPQTLSTFNIDGRGQTLLTPQLASSDACLCIHRGVRPPHLAGVAPTPGTGMHSRPVHQAPPSGPFYSDESQQSTTPLTSALAHTDERPVPHPLGDITARAPLSIPIPCTSPTASRADRGGGEWRPDAAPGLLDGCILGAATHLVEERGRTGPCTAAVTARGRAVHPAP